MQYTVSIVPNKKQGTMCEVVCNRPIDFEATQVRLDDWDSLTARHFGVGPVEGPHLSGVKGFRAKYGPAVVRDAVRGKYGLLGVISRHG